MASQSTEIKHVPPLTKPMSNELNSIASAKEALGLSTDVQSFFESAHVPRPQLSSRAMNETRDGKTNKRKNADATAREAPGEEPRYCICVHMLLYVYSYCYIVSSYYYVCVRSYWICVLILQYIEKNADTATREAPRVRSRGVPSRFTPRDLEMAIHASSD